MAKLIFSSRKLDKSSIVSSSFTESSFYSRLIIHVTKNKLRDRVNISFNKKTKRQEYKYIPSNEYIFFHSKFGLK